jgi:HlyD family secretion protein
MRRNITITIIALACAGLLAQAFVLNRGEAVPQAAPPAPEPALVAAPGRVEPVSEEIEVGAEIGGKLASVSVEEGDRVRRGQIIATLENADYHAQVASAAALVEQREAQLRRVVNGARDQERLAASAAVEETAAVVESTRAETKRRQILYGQGVIAREEAERAEREYLVARARWEAAGQRHALVDDDAREEDRAESRAGVALARAELALARARLEKTVIRSPIDGIVLRKHLERGESVSDQFSTPIVTVADSSILRVRADVDETDVGQIRLGQRAYVTAEAFGDRRFSGRVVRIGQVLGKKNVRTDEPVERVDKKILETLVELEEGRELPPGLRVDVFIATGGGLE